MAIELECASVIVPIESIEARYPGGVATYRDDCPSNSYLQDELLTRVGFMSTSEAVRHLGQVASKGLRVTDDQSASDVVLINGRDSNPTCTWLECGEHGDTVACWLRGYPPGELVRWQVCPIYQCPAASLRDLQRIFRDAGFDSRFSGGGAGRLICERGTYRFEVEIIGGDGLDGDGFILAIPQHGRVAGAPDDTVLLQELDAVLRGYGLSTPSKG